MLKRFEEYFVTDMFQKETSYCYLTETDGTRYKIKTLWSKNRELLVIKPSKMKELTKYIQPQMKPKDCDYILVDREDKNFFFIELKKKGTTSTAKKIAEQLKAGTSWMKHILFIMGLSDTYQEYNEFLISCKVDARPQKTRASLKPDCHGVYNIQGTNLNLLFILNKDKKGN